MKIKGRGKHRQQIAHVDPVAVERALCRRSLADFVRCAWHVVEPEAPLLWGWHIDAICTHLEAVSRGEISRLLINVPPGHMKSLLVSVFWPAWVWTHRPSWRALFGSYAMELSTRDNVRCRDVVTSDWYQRTFRPAWKLKEDQNVKTWFENTAGGLRMALAVGGKGTGFRGDAVIFDDPHNVKERPSDAELETVGFWWFKRMSSRLNDPRTGVRVGIMQRLHTKDLAGKILARGDYVHLSLPTRFRPEKRCATPIGWSDPRAAHDELLFPEMFPDAVVAEAREDLGEYGFAGQHQQEPIPEGGGVIKARWWRFWYPAAAPEPPPVRVQIDDGSSVACEQTSLPGVFDRTITSWDMAFKGAPKSDFVTGQVWAASGAHVYLLDQEHARLDFPATLEVVKDLTARYPHANAHLVEDKANGPAIISTLQGHVPAMLAVEPDGGKEARCSAVSPMIEAGNVYLPHPALFPWVQEFLTEVTTFPYGDNDDQVDAATQALNWLRPRIGRQLRTRRI